MRARMAYLTLDQFTLLSTIPAEFISAVEQRQPGYTEAQLEQWSHWIDAQLVKRYAVPFIEPFPAVVSGWLARIVTVKVWTKRGVDPEDEQWKEIKEDDSAARAEIAAAANSETGLYELPLKQELPRRDGVSQGFPKGYSEASPYVWADQQIERAAQEDSSRRGSGG